MSGMRQALSTWGMSALFVLVASGQTAPVQTAPVQTASDTVRTFQLVGGESPEALQGISYVVSSVAELPKPAVDAAKATIAVTGGPDQIALAAWMIGELDHPAKSADLTYLPPGGGDSVARIFYLAHVSNPEPLQELVNVIRSMTEIRPMAAYNPAQAIVLRGTHAQVDQAEWIVKALDLDAGSALPAVAATAVAFPPGSAFQNPDARAYHMRHNQVRIFYLKNNETPQQTQEIMNVLRSVTEMQRITAFSPLRAICVMGSAPQADAAAWLVSELEKPTPKAVAQDSYYMTPENGADGEVRVFFVPGTETPQAMQHLVDLIRMAHILRITAYNSTKAIAIRGTAGQVAAAEQAMQQSAQK